MTLNQIDIFDELVEQGYSREEAYVLNNRVLNEYDERTRLYNKNKQ